MKTFAAIITATLVLLPTLATAQTCEKKWRETYGSACPAGSSYDSITNSCMIHSS